MRFARFVLVAQALVMASLSLAYWIRPHEMANLSGILLMEDTSVSQMRTWYGGLQLGLAGFLLWAMRSEERARPALVLLICALSALAIGRLGSLLIDGGSLVGFDLLILLGWVVGILLATVAGLVIRERTEDVPEKTRAPMQQTFIDTSPQPFRRGDDELGRPALPFCRSDAPVTSTGAPES